MEFIITSIIVKIPDSKVTDRLSCCHLSDPHEMQEHNSINYI